MTQGTERYQVAIAIGLVALAMVGAVVWIARASGGSAEVLTLTTPVASRSPTAQPPLRVHVVGAVVTEGVFDLTAGARVADAVDAAGGFAPDADRQSLNLAASVKDGQQVRVLFLGNAVSGQRTAAPSLVGCSSPGKTNINTASAAELEKLPRIGEATVAKIIAYRQQHGRFAAVEELRDAKILARTSDFDEVKDLVCAE